MNIEQILGWAGNILFFIGVYSLGKKKIAGFYCNGSANFLYILQSIIMQNLSLFWLSVGLMVLNVVGIAQWSKIKVTKNV